MNALHATDGVSIAFDLILEEFAVVEAQLNQEGALAFQLSRYGDADRLSDAGKHVEGFRHKVEALSEEWRSGIDIQTRERVKVRPSYHLRPHKQGLRTNLRVMLGNGQVIPRDSAAPADTEVQSEPNRGSSDDLGSRAASPSPTEWLKRISELSSLSGRLRTWSAICRYLGIDVGGDSARRRLSDWVKSNRPDWPNVPEPTSSTMLDIDLSNLDI